MERVKDVVFDIKDQNKRVIHSYCLKSHENKNDIVRLALEDAAARKIPLTGAVLTGFKIENAVLNGLDLEGADLKGTLFRNCNLDGANLFNANMQHTQIIGTSMKEVFACEADFQHSIILKSDLSGSNIIHSNFSAAIFHNSNLDRIKAEIGFNVFEGAFLLNTSLKQSRFNSLCLNSSILIDCDFQGAELGHSQVSDVLFNRCNFNDTHFAFTRGKDTKFAHSPLLNAHLASSLLSKPVINGIVVMDGAGLLAELLNGPRSPERNPVEIKTPEQVAEMLAAIKARDNAAIIALKIKHNAGQDQFQMHAQNLSNLDLSGLDLSHMDFSGSLFTNSKLTNTNFTRSVLNGTIIGTTREQQLDATQINLTHAVLKTSYLSNIDLPFAKASGCDLSFSKLHCIKAQEGDFQHSRLLRVFMGNRTALDGANFNGSEITHTRIQNSTAACGIFTGTEISTLDVSYSDISDSDFTGSNVQGMNIGHSDAHQIRFKGVPLVGLKALHSDLSGADLSGGVMSNCAFRHTDLNRANLDGSMVKLGSFVDVDCKATDLNGSCFIDTTIKNSDLRQAKNIPESAYTSAGLRQKTEHRPLSRADSARHLTELRSRIIERNSNFDLS